MSEIDKERLEELSESNQETMDILFSLLSESAQNHDLSECSRLIGKIKDRTNRIATLKFLIREIERKED